MAFPTTYFHRDDNTMTELPREVYEKADTLEIVEITNCKLTDVSVLFTNRFPNLRKINLNNNNITHIPNISTTLPTEERGTLSFVLNSLSLEGNPLKTQSLLNVMDYVNEWKLILEEDIEEKKRNPAYIIHNKVTRIKFSVPFQSPPIVIDMHNIQNDMYSKYKITGFEDGFDVQYTQLEKKIKENIDRRHTALQVLKAKGMAPGSFRRTLSFLDGGNKKKKANKPQRKTRKYKKTRK